MAYAISLSPPPSLLPLQCMSFQLTASGIPGSACPPQGTAAFFGGWGIFPGCA
jgi:hypothetical protein